LILRFTIIAVVGLVCGNRALCDQIHDAARDGDVSKVQSLLKNNPDLAFSKDEDSNTPLHLAAQNGHSEIAELLLAHRADVNAGNKDGLTPLHYAAMNGKRDVVELLLAHGADVNGRMLNGLTPLHQAAFGGYQDVVEILLAKGADVNVNARMAGGLTPLHWAVQAGHREVAELLLAEGADVNARMLDGRTPLHLAADNDHRDLVEWLLAHGADVYAMDNGGRTPLDSLRMMGAWLKHHQEIAKLLEEKEITVNPKEQISTQEILNMLGDTMSGEYPAPPQPNPSQDTRPAVPLFDSLLGQTKVGRSFLWTSFRSIDESGYVLAQTQVMRDASVPSYSTSANRGTQLIQTTFYTTYFHYGPEQLVAVRFSDIAEIKVTKWATNAKAHDVILLDRRGSVPGNLWVFPDTRDRVLSALHALCPNAVISEK
jgi:ankyrin repeat protein